jgi:hypothetical protein
MAVSPFVTPSAQKLRVKDVQEDRANSEAINQKLAGAINELIDRSNEQIELVANGYYENTKVFQQAPYYVRSNVDIIGYYLSIWDTGTAAQDNAANFLVTDNVGAVITNLFDVGANRLVINEANGGPVVVGRDIENATTFTSNAAGATVQFGNLTQTTLNAGDVVSPYIQNAGVGSRSMRCVLFLRNQ